MGKQKLIHGWQEHDAPVQILLQSQDAVHCPPFISLECVYKIIFICHSEARSAEESQSTEQFHVHNRDSSLITVAQNDMTLFCTQTL